MPCYEYICGTCGQRFDRYVEVEMRDSAQACEYCGCGAIRQFLPSEILLPWTFNACMISDVAQTYEQAKAQDRRNEEYLANKPPTRKSFEQCTIDELDKRGNRHPHRLIEP